MPIDIQPGTKYTNKAQPLGNGVAIYLPVDVAEWAGIEPGTEVAIVCEQSKKYGNYLGIGKKK